MKKFFILTFLLFASFSDSNAAEKGVLDWYIKQNNIDNVNQKNCEITVGGWNLSLVKYSDGNHQIKSNRFYKYGSVITVRIAENTYRTMTKVFSKKASNRIVKDMLNESNQRIYAQWAERASGYKKFTRFTAEMDLKSFRDSYAKCNH